MTNDPNRLLMIIKDRHILVDRLKKILVRAKEDNAGDVFQINRLLKHHQNLLSELETYLKSLIADRKMLDSIHHKNRLKEEEAALNKLRVDISAWGIGE